MHREGGGQFNKTYQSPIAPQRNLLKPNLNNCERQDTTSFEARASFDHSDKHGGTYRETCRGGIDFRIPGMTHSAVQEHDHIRKKAVQKLIHQFEHHPNKEALQEDQQQKRAFNPFSEQSKEMIYSMGNMEYFEISEITPNIQCSNCVTCWPKGTVYCTCGTCLRPSHKVRKLNSGFVIKKARPIGNATGTQTDRESTIKPMSLLSKRRRRSTHQYRIDSIQDRFLGCLTYRQSQLNIGWTEDHCARLDQIAADDHSYIATAAERARRENTWVLVLNSSGPNGPLNQREYYQDDKRICELLYQESGQAHHRLHPREQVRVRPDQPLAWHDEGSKRVDPKTGWKWYDTQPAASSSSSGWQPSARRQSSSWSQTSTGVGVFFFSSQGVSLAGNGDSFVNDGVCKHCTQPTHTSHARTREFSRVAQDLSHRVRFHVALTKQSFFTS